MALSVPVRITCTKRAGRPLNSTRFSPSSNPSRIVATSPSTTSDPFAARNGIRANSASEYACPRVRTIRVPLPLSMTPAGRSMEKRRIASARSWKVRL